MKKILRGGTVVNASGRQAADVLIDGEKVAAVAPGLSCGGAEIIDVSGKLLFPGFIDAHTHFDLDVCNTTTADDFYTGGRSALRGGTTMVIDFACPNKGETLQYGLAQKSGRKNRLRLWLPYDHRRLERRHHRRAAQNV